jgi:hypothetical protein
VALDMLLWSLPEEVRAAALAHAVEALRGVFAAAGHTPPRWVDDLLAGWRPGDPPPSGDGAGP